MMDQQGRPNEPQFVYRRDPETGGPVAGHLRWGPIPHFCDKRPDFARIHARAETVAENEWLSDGPTGIIGEFVKQLDTLVDDGNTASGSMRATPTTGYALGAAATPTAQIDNSVPYTVCMGI